MTPTEGDEAVAGAEFPTSDSRKHQHKARWESQMVMKIV